MRRLFSSTRAYKEVSPSTAILKGISDEGGLFVPEHFPAIDIEKLKHCSYREICFVILSEYLTDFDHDVLKKMITKAYDKFSTNNITPVISFNQHHILELFHGPTLAFKDVALSILPYLIMESAKIQKIHDEIVILTATSGDTGKAALEGFANIDHTKIIVFYPSEGVSEIQKKQMISQEGNNVYVIGTQGNFDDAQNGVKKIFNDQVFKKELKGMNIILSSANSINIGRLLPQVVYYFSAYMQLVNQGVIQLHDKVNFTVPTGNFGNILAGYYAKEMGLPINKLICASNTNNVLFDFFNTGEYNKNRPFVKTISPSMDILISSNFERLLYHMSNHDKHLITQWMTKLSEQGHYRVPDSIKKKINHLFYGNYCDEASTKETIGKFYREFGYVLDTHTAVACKVYQDYVNDTGDSKNNIILSTASPFKFTKSVYESIFENSQGNEFSLISQLAEKTHISIPKQICNIEKMPILHKDIIPATKMKEAIFKILKQA
ncbi:MAG: threonine synthase [Eubacteriales bacterium]